MRHKHYSTSKPFKHYLSKCPSDPISNGSELSLTNKHGTKIASCEGYELPDYRSLGRR